MPCWPGSKGSPTTCDPSSEPRGPGAPADLFWIYRPLPVRIPFLVTVLVVASLIDLREQRVPNAIPAALLLAGIVLGAANGMAGAGQALAGALLAGGVLLPLYALGGMGAGDVKLMGGAGAMLGWKLGGAAAGLALVAG